MLDLIIPKASTREKFAAATSADPTLGLVKEILSKGWPEHKSHCPVAAKPFWGVRNALSEADGLLLYGSRLVVPVSLRPEVLEGIHDGHFGELKCILRAKSAVYWPGCDEQIRNMVASCVTCQTHRHRNPSPPLRPVSCHHTHSSMCRETYLRLKVSTIFSSWMHTANGRLVCLSVH